MFKEASVFPTSKQFLEEVGGKDAGSGRHWMLAVCFHLEQDLSQLMTTIQKRDKLRSFVVRISHQPHGRCNIELEGHFVVCLIGENLA